MTIYIKTINNIHIDISFYLQDGVHLLKGKEDVKYIRVRVVRLVGPMTCVYGIDMGSTHVCNAADLILLPASILNCAPCGRLARLPGKSSQHSCCVVSYIRWVVLSYSHMVGCRFVKLK